ncbi:proline iminopeptidase [Hamadaea flava]|uniref:Proline iminopeptidase n=1 Tax=Hamadaea flava TaxID=1742688 RepID=A0ABV8LTL4_9ACTN|nr:prolyl aminopeptidase [Hamadaea flava]MCP2321771.1 proline iminopeptidase [Hamadaea flava]
MGMLDVGDGNRLYWEVLGNPDGKPAVCLHGGPGSGAGPFWARNFDLTQYRVVLFDQRGCGRSTPNVADHDTCLATNTTAQLIADIERLREHLGIDRWLVYGGSWGSTLGLAYAEAHPASVSELVLFSVVTTTAAEVDWVTRQMGRIFPAEWDRFAGHVPAAERDGNLAAAYARLLSDPDPQVRAAAAEEWCRWEDTHVAVLSEPSPDPRYADPRFRLQFARLVTHYWANAGFLPDGRLLADAVKLNGIPGVLVTGRADVSGPPDVAYRLAQRWTDAELVIVGPAEHGSGHPEVTRVLREAFARYAQR